MDEELDSHVVGATFVVIDTLDCSWALRCWKAFHLICCRRLKTVNTGPQGGTYGGTEERKSRASGASVTIKHMYYEDGIPTGTP